jgi:SAM-dependent methyltransferase
MKISSDAARNRTFWDQTSDEYQQRHAEFIGQPQPRWGTWQLPEDELGVLGDVARKDVLELGCGAAQWSVLLARRGARVVGLDNSARQLEHAARRLADEGLELPLVHASAEDVPLADGSFDVVFCDYGALSWADRYRVVPEASRLLRPGGLLAFSHTTPFAWVCWDDEGDGIAPRLNAAYFGMNRHEEPDGSVHFNLPYGEWIRLFRENGLRVDALIEIRPPEGGPSTYLTPADTEWARSWPMEEIWRCRRI